MDPFQAFLHQKMVPPGAQVIPPPQPPMGGVPQMPQMPQMPPQQAPPPGDNPFMQWMQAQQGGQQMPPQPMASPMAPPMGGMPAGPMGVPGGMGYGDGVAAARRLLGMG